ncbi:MAG: metallopeptidase TldD-related protein [Alphaproteobacteria bacterium]|nr:metallopeptidase TldD-related protein [Alphaproteobacteria bacterium]
MDKATLVARAEQAVAAARKAGAEAADALALASTDISASIRHGQPESIEQAESCAIGLRVFIGTASATLSTSEFSAPALAHLAEQAVAIARVAPADPYTGLADERLLALDAAPLEAADDFIPDMRALQAQAREAEAAGLAVRGIRNSEGGDASASRHCLALVTSHGFSGAYYTARYAVSASLIAGEGEHMQRDYDYAMTTHHADLTAASLIGQRAAERAVSRLNPRKISSRQAVVYFEPRTGRQLLSAFAGAISGSAIARGTSFLKDALGTKIFAGNIRITDDPQLKRGLASRAFDAEGVTANALDIVADGTLTSWILDTRSARQLGLVTTGHAARGLASSPHPSPSNLYLHGGTQTPDALFATMGDGFYVTETIGHGTNLLTGDFSVGASGFWLEGGERAYPVSEVTIAGNLRDIFASLVPANDLAFTYGINVPTLAVPCLTIAGS